MELQIIRAQEFVRVGKQGTFDLEESREMLAAIAKAFRKRGIHRALLDGREARTELTPNDLAELIRTFGEIGFTHEDRLALLHDSDRAFRARLFALIGNLRGWQLKAFDDYEEAMEWLSEEENSEGDPHSKPGAIGVPIKIRSYDEKPGL